MARPPGRPPGRPRKSPIFNKPSRDYDRPSIEALEPTPNFDLLSEDEKAEIRAKAEAKVIDDEKQRAWQAFLDAEVKRLEKELHPEAYEEEKEITIDLALFADRIILDGRTYMHGRKYTVKKSVYDSLAEIQSKTWKHYHDTHRDPERVLQEAAQAIAKGGAPGYAQISGSTGQVTRF
jgi:hypothetical protein